MCTMDVDNIANWIGHVNEYPTMHYFENPRHSVNDSILYDFDWEFLEVPVKNCMVGMLLTRPIICDSFWYCSCA